MATSPTQRSLKLMRDQGYLCAIVEHWNAFARIRQDLYGFVDVLCIKDGKTIAVQTTSYSNVSARIKKIQGLESYPIVKSAGWEIVVHGWRKNKSNRWEVREVFLE
jgi:hypothetical protein